MILVHLQGELTRLHDGIEYLKDDIGISLSEEGIPINICYEPDNQFLHTSFDGEKGKIIYSTVNNFFRQLNLWVIHYKKGLVFEKREHAYFDKTGAMIDASRNAVLNTSGVKEFLRHFAKLGLNQAMLYTEDTYEVKEHPYFGYLRGRYTKEELQEVDNYANALGIEMIPCIQTLGHLFQALKYGTLHEIQDTSDVLLVGEPKTYVFLEAIIKAATAPFRSNRIHIGMDEAFGVGTGRYKQLNGERDTFEIMNEHVQKVTEITDRLGLEAMMWSDMYFRTGSKNGDYYDTESEVPKTIIEGIPEVDMVFWDYYHEDQAAYEKLLEKHIRMKRKVIFAGGVWTWNGISPNYSKTFETTKAALKACKKTGIKEVFATMWGDDGGETPVIAALPGLQFFADLSYRETADQQAVNDEFLHNTGIDFEDFILLNTLDETPGVMKNNLHTSAGSKVLLWQDPFLGIFDKAAEGHGLDKHYRRLAGQLEKLVNQNHTYKELFAFYHQLAYVLSFRAEFGLKVKLAYSERNSEALKKEFEKAESLQVELKKLRKFHRDIWMKYNKPFGWEVLDIRYGGVIARMDTAKDRLQQYLNGEISRIEELEEEKLMWSSGKGTIGRGLYKDIVTTSKLSGV